MASPISRVQLRVADLQRSLGFYKKLLNMEIRRDEGRVVALAPAGSSNERLVLREVTGLTHRPRNPRTAGLYHVAWLLPNRAELGRALIGLHDARYPMTGASNHAVSESLYLDDPDGNGVEIYADRPRDTWQWTNGRVHMTVDPLDVNDVASAAIGHGPTGAWRGLPSETLIGHVHFTVPDLNQAMAFYAKEAAMAVTFEMPSLVGMSVDQYHHHVNLNTWAGEGAPPDDPDVAGLDVWTFNGREFPAHQTT